MADLKTVVGQKSLCGLSASDKNELAVCSLRNSDL